jgi:hypothetical protein
LIVLWTFLPLLVLVLFYVFVGEEELELKRVKVVLGTAIALYTGIKLVSLPSFLLHIPFLDQGPPQLLVSGMPLIILILALAAMYAHTRRAERATLFPAFLIFVLTDALLSMAIYAPGIFGGS